MERVLLISPVRDEAEHIEAVAAAVEAQSRTPDLWLVVDDGSTDDTQRILREQAERLSFLRVVRTPAGHTRDGTDRLAAAAPDRAWNFGLRQVDRSDFTHLGKLDGDVVFGPEFIAAALDRFRADPGLGMIGGSLVERGPSGWKPLRAAPGHVSGACRLYARPCFEAIGGMPERLGADGITVAYAQMRGFRTATLEGQEVRHLRRHGTAQGNLRGYARRGRYMHVLHYFPAWVAMRAGSAALRETPYGLSGIWLFGGYVGAKLRGLPQVEDPELRTFVRAQLRSRIAARLSGRRPASGPAAFIRGS